MVIRRKHGNTSYVSELYHLFEHLCPEVFQFLIDDFGFALVGMNENGECGITATYKNSTTGLEVSLEPRDGGIYVYIIKLVDGGIPPYLKVPSHWLLLDCLIQVHSPSSRRVVKLPGEQLTLRDVTVQLKMYAKSVATCAADMLRGDFSELAEVWTRCHDMAATV